MDIYCERWILLILDSWLNPIVLKYRQINYKRGDGWII